MTVLPWAGFIAEFPDDQVEEEGDIAVFGGRNVAFALGDILKEIGCENVSPPRYDGENGWVFNLDYGRGHSFFCQITSLHPAFWLLFKGSHRRNLVYEEIWRKFADALEHDRRFHSVVWRSEDDGPPGQDEIGDEQLREVVRRIPPEPIPEQDRPRRHKPARVTRAHYAYALIVCVVFSIPFAIAFAFCAMLVYLGAWWAIFGVLAVALVYWRYLGRNFWGLIRPVGSTFRTTGRSSTPAVVGIWCAMAFMVVPMVDAYFRGTKAQSIYAALAMATLVVTLAVVLWIIDRRRARRSPVSRKAEP